MEMSGGQRSALWLLFGLLLIAAFALGGRDEGLREGAQGSYLGRTVAVQPVPPAMRDAFDNRANSGQRY
jgi:hypothetical protein